MRKRAGGSIVLGERLQPQAHQLVPGNLPFAQFEVNSLAPALSFPDEQFDLAYALLVFTHLPEPLQHQWITGARARCQAWRPGLVHDAGDAWSWKPAPEKRAPYDAGDVVVRCASGTNLCAVFHPWRYVHERFVNGFVVKESIALMDRGQNVHGVEQQPDEPR
jgi:hypothetical protein